MDTFVDNEVGLSKRRRILRHGCLSATSVSGGEGGPAAKSPAAGNFGPSTIDLRGSSGLHLVSEPPTSVANPECRPVDDRLDRVGHRMDLQVGLHVGPRTDVCRPAGFEERHETRVEAFVDDVAQDEAYGAVQSWFRRPERHPKPLLVIGPSGCGKSAIIRHFSRPQGLECYDDQDLADFLSPVGLRTKCPGLLDGIEGLDASERQLVKKALGAKNGRRLVLTAEDAFEEPAKSWSSSCHVVKFERPSPAHCVRVLVAHGSSEDVARALVDSSDCNLGSAMAGLVFGRTGAPDVPMSAPKAVATLLRHEAVPCIGGSSDVSFIHMLYGLNAVQAPCNVKTRLRTCDAVSFMDLLGHEMPTENMWDLLQLVASCGPRIDRVPTFIWPSGKKSSKASFSLTSIAGVTE